MSHRLLLGLTIAAAIPGCTVGPDYVSPEFEAPDHWTERQDARRGSDETALRRLRHWWSEFDDPMLNRLVDQAIAGNYDVKIATQRLVVARANRDIAASGFYPSVNFAAAAQRAVSSTTARFVPGIGPFPTASAFNTFQGGFDASWEIDVFGGIRRRVEAADASVGAAVEDRRDVLLSLLAELGVNYATLRASQERLAIAQRNITAARQAFTLTKQRFDRGLVSDIDVAQASAQLETFQAVVPQLEATIAATTHAIGVLLGRLPGDLEAELSKPGPVMPVPPSLPISMPSDVVRERPDIRRAERALASATAQVGVAVAQLFPRFDIPLSIGVLSSTIGQLLTGGSLAWGFGVTVSQPIFEGGRLDAQIRLTKAVAEQDRLAYEQTVLAAFRDVEDALVSFSSEERRRARIAAAVADNRKALDSATRLYGAGLTDFLRVLDSERSLYAAEDSLALSDLAKVLQTIALLKALGGGWQDIDPGDQS
jgi:NodT family efflux transporter outer membrane factor (OMF) lipoprotein